MRLFLYAIVWQNYFLFSFLLLLNNLRSGEKLNLKSVNFPRNGISGDSSETQQIDQVFMKMENKMMLEMVVVVMIMSIIMMVMIMMMTSDDVGGGDDRYFILI